MPVARPWHCLLHSIGSQTCCTQSGLHHVLLSGRRALQQPPATSTRCRCHKIRCATLLGPLAAIPIPCLFGFPFLEYLAAYRLQKEHPKVSYCSQECPIAYRELVKVMMRQNDIPFSDARLQAVGFAEVYTRMCGNLVNIYSHSRNASRQRIMLDMLLAIAPGNVEYRIRRAQVCHQDMKRNTNRKLVVQSCHMPNTYLLRLF